MDRSSSLDFFRIYDEHYQIVRNLVGSMVRDQWAVDDLTQDTFVRAFQSIHALKKKDRIKSCRGTRVRGD